MEPLSRDEVGAALETIGDELVRIEEVMVDASTGATSFLTQTATYLTKAGGKRVRPAVIVLSAQVGPNGATEDAFKTAAAMELTHLATLYHDDVIDEADTRRGVPSANERWDNKVAILAGDFLFARASGLAAAVGGQVPVILARAISDVVEGQVLELESTYDPMRSEEQYMRTIGGKTAALVESCAEVGALLGGCSADEIAAMVTFGSSFGYAFQVADDLLDLAATQEELGKAPGTDLRDGVYTLPVIYARDADPSIAARLGTPDVDVEQMRAAVIATGGFDRAFRVASEYVDKALTALKEVPDGRARVTLETLTRLVIDRVPEIA